MNKRPAPPRVIKKYGNRRLYDTTLSSYVTLDELAASIRAGHDARIVDAQTGDDLTQTTLTQMILEGRGAAQFLSVPILTQLLRMSDDALAEFFGRYVSMALDFYQQTRSGMQSFGPFAPFAMPYAASSALARLVGNALPFGAGSQAPAPSAYAQVAPPMPPDAALDEPAAPTADSIALDDLRRKLDALEKTVRAGQHERAPKRLPPAPKKKPAPAAAKKKPARTR
ncbi:MAG: polyhydroxyalkanoate synthesis regulator DNA-binding domain-containing protein [Deltaproteobacteria bacterium]|jgi:polyhydroxyalkanoate synthesis repressor PhaR|nr:polyhydroxyalkanoate synthesis regulator DNA-binding domain-containing protein [Myxococcales bacterium]MDP3218251.1 polyhydroxyalkanoate synthesis regulator DNA-binding domain-containing protein [Deltaproteobacteria bacterium]